MLSLLVSVAVLLLGAYAYVANPSRAASLATRLLESTFNVKARIDEAHFGLDGTIKLRGLRLDVLDMPEAGSRLIDVEHVTIEHKSWSLIVGRFEPTKMTLRAPILHITEEPNRNRFNYQLLIRKHGGESAMAVPAVVVHDGVIRSGEVTGGRYTRVGEVRIDGELFDAGSGSRMYRFDLGQKKQISDDGPQLSGRFNLGDGSVTARLDRFSIDSPQRNLLPRALREWWDQYEPSGSLSTVTFEYSPDPSVGLKALVELTDAALSLPQTEPSTRLSSVTGRIAIENDLIRPELKCVVEHQQPNFTADCEISGWVKGTQRNAPYDLSIRAKGNVPVDAGSSASTVPWEQLPRVSKIVRWIFHRFAPKGQFDASIQVARGPDGSPPASVRGTVDLTGDGRFLLFPYPLYGVKARLRLADDGIEIVKLAGKSEGGASVTLAGKVFPLSQHPAVDVHIVGNDVPIDEDLFSAIQVKRPQVVPAIDMFMDRKAHRQVQARLKQQLAAAESKRASVDDPAALSRLEELISRRRKLLERFAAFEPGGKVASLAAKVTRSNGPGRPTNVSTELDLTGVGILFRHWPYPVRATKGRLIIGPDKVVADGIEGRGLDDRVILTIDGTVTTSSGDWSQAIPDLTVTASQLPLDDLLIATVPTPQDQVIRSLGLSGHASAVAHVFRNKKGKIDFAIKMKVNDVRARPNDGRFAIDQVRGELTVGPKHIEIDSFEGVAVRPSEDREPACKLKLSGRASWEGSRTSCELHLIGTDLRLEDPLADLLPAGSEPARAIAALIEQHRPRGHFDADLRCSSRDGEPLDYTLRLTPKRMAFDLNDQTVELQDITGGLTLTPKAVSMNAFQGSWGVGRFDITGSVQLVEPFEKQLRLSASADRLDATARAFLPQAVVRTLEALRADGPYRISNCELHVLPMATKGIRSRFDGTIHIEGASGVIGVPITDLIGDLRVQTRQMADAEWPVVQLTLNADRLRADQRLISPLTAQIETDGKQADRLVIRKLEGTCYGGSLAGSGWVDLDDNIYNLRLTLHDSALESIIDPSSAGSEGAAPKKKNISKGRIAAALAVEGLVGDTARRRGRGELRIRDAVMYELPLTLGLVHVVNLAVPTSGAFDRADIAYEIDEGVIRFEQLRFHAPSVEMVGSGTMQYETRELDLSLYARNPERLLSVTVSELINKFKDELMSIRVTGTLDKPQVQVQSLRGIRRSWDRIFGDQEQVGPITQVVEE